MSTPSHPLELRLVAAAGVLAAAVLAAPPDAGAQSGPAERALLNRSHVSVVAPVAGFRHALPVRPATAPVSGERALLARISIPYATPAPESRRGAPAVPVAGTRALLGRLR